MASDARADAKMLGPERTAALVRAVLAEPPVEGCPVVRLTPDGRESLEAAARRLAAPEPAEPQWDVPVVAYFEDGRLTRAHRADDRATRLAGEEEYPARLVPLDGSAVVLTRASAAALLAFANGPDDHGEPWMALQLAINELAAALAAASKEAGR